MCHVASPKGFHLASPSECQRGGVVQGTDRSSQSCSATRAEQTLKTLGRDGKEGEDRTQREAEQLLTSSPAAHLQCQQCQNIFTQCSTNDRGSGIYLLKDRFVIVDIINFHNNLGSTCERVGPSRGIIISSCDIQDIFCPLQLRKWACTESNQPCKDKNLWGFAALTHSHYSSHY